MSHKDSQIFANKGGASAFLRAFVVGALALWLTVPVGGEPSETNCDCDTPDQSKYLLAENEHQGDVQRTMGTNSASSAEYMDPELPIEQRMDDLLPRLTLDEKISQLMDSWGSPGIPRLNVPVLLKTEGLHSQSYSQGATLFPQAIAMAATFDPELINQVGRATAIEAKAANIRASWSPVLDVARDARWGRVEETYGEDPYLVSLMGVAWITGFQSENMIAVPKHFAGHGGPLGGRDSNDVGLSDRTMREVFLVPFRAAVEEAHAGGIMAAYSTWDGTPDNASTELLQNILRQEWGFDGIVVSDCGGPEQFLTKQSVVSNLEEACQLAIRAGVDIECGGAFKKSLASAVHDGLLSESDLDENVRDVLRAKFRLGLFENPGPSKMVWDKLSAYDTPEHRALARQAAVESIVLLKNSDHLLPLSKTIGTIAVIGPNADEAQTGDYSPKVTATQMVAVLQGVKSHVSPGTKVLYAKGCDATSEDTSGIAPAVETARQADAVILVVGDHSLADKAEVTTGENVDGATLEIPGVQRELIKAVQATGKPVVLVLVNGKPFTLEWESTNIPAILETWYPGEEGGDATADIIFGDQNPAGRLPITFPRSASQLPLYYNYLPSGRNYGYYDMPFTPRYRFGYGLSYTTFKYSNLTIVPRSNDPGYVSVSVDVENTGDRDGDEVVQLYVTDLLTSVITPVIELKGVKRVSLKEGEKKTVTFELTPYELSFLNADMDRVVEPSQFRIHVGGASPEPPSGNMEHKSRIGFKDPSEGITGEFDMPEMYHADFKCSLDVPAQVQGGSAFFATVAVTNNGNLLDVAKISLYGDSLLGTHRFEIPPGESRRYSFNVAFYKSGTQTLTAVIGKRAVTRTINVSESPAHLTIGNAVIHVDDDGVLRYGAEATNVGSETYKGNFAIRVDGKIVASQMLELSPGDSQAVRLSCAFPHSGEFRVQIGDAAEQQILVPGAISLAVSDPLIYLKFDTANISSVKNEIDGSMLSVQGRPKLVPGKESEAFDTDDKETFINAGGADLYRKSFTLAAWVNIEKLADGQAMFFGGQAPMGADVDTTGTGLAAGVFKGSPLLSFWNQDVRGRNKIATGQWLHLAYTYDADAGRGSIYVNGKLDKTAAQSTYDGPLNIIGGASRFKHGKYLMDDVLVTRDCLEPTAIAVLAGSGVEALQDGEMVTDWRSISSSSLTQMETWSNIPKGSSIMVTIQSGDDGNQVIDSKTFNLESGDQSVSLAGLESGKKERLRIRLTATKWGGVPTLQSVSLAGPDQSIKWATVAEWQKGSRTGGLEIKK